MRHTNQLEFAWRVKFSKKTNVSSFYYHRNRSLTVENEPRVFLTDVLLSGGIGNQTLPDDTVTIFTLVSIVIALFAIVGATVVGVAFGYIYKKRYIPYHVNVGCSNFTIVKEFIHIILRYPNKSCQLPVISKKATTTARSMIMIETTLTSVVHVTPEMAMFPVIVRLKQYKNLVRNLLLSW